METQEKYCTKEDLENLDFTPRIEKLGITEKQFADKLRDIISKYEDECGYVYFGNYKDIIKSIVNYINPL